MILCDKIAIAHDEREALRQSPRIEISINTQFTERIFVSFDESVEVWTSFPFLLSNKVQIPIGMKEVVAKMKARLAAIDPNVPRTVFGIFQINIQTANEEKTLTVDLNKLEWIGEPVENPDTTLDIDEISFISISKRETTFEEALQGGKVRLTGNTELAAAFDKFLCNGEAAWMENSNQQQRKSVYESQ